MNWVKKSHKKFFRHTCLTKYILNSIHVSAKLTFIYEKILSKWFRIYKIGNNREKHNYTFFVTHLHNDLIWKHHHCRIIIMEILWPEMLFSRFLSTLFISEVFSFLCLLCICIKTDNVWKMIDLSKCYTNEQFQFHWALRVWRYSVI